jgi:hypothetical protein
MWRRPVGVFLTVYEVSVMGEEVGPDERLSDVGHDE